VGYKEKENQISNSGSIGMRKPETISEPLVKRKIIKIKRTDHS